MSDVVVVGAGLIGCGIAYEAAKRGMSVTVLDRAEPAGAASWAGAGMLAPFSEATPDDAYVAFCREALAIYPAFVDELRERTGVDAHMRREGTLHVALDAAALASLTAAAPVFRRNGGAVSLIDRDTALAREPLLSRALVGALFVANEAQVDNRRLGAALVAACRGLGVRFDRVDALALEADTRRVRGLRTSRGFVTAPQVVNAAGAWAGVLEGVPPHARIPVQPVAGEMLSLALPPGAVQAQVWLGHRYLVPRRDGRLLVGATVEARGFDARVTAGGQRDLLDAALAVAPALAERGIEEQWAGLRPGSADGRPYLGRTSLEGYVAAAGHYRNGILLAPLTARTVAAVLAGEDDGALAPFSPRRAEAVTTSANPSA